MQKKIIIAVVVYALLAGAFYTATKTRLFKDSPNVIIILTDDMDNSLMPYMEKTNQLISEQGATFSNYFELHSGYLSHALHRRNEFQH